MKLGALGTLVLALSMPATAARAQEALVPRSADAAAQKPDVATESAAEKPHRLVWNEEWPRFRVIEYVASAALAIQLGVLEFATPSPSEPRMDGGILFDNKVRHAMRLDGRPAREAAGRASDITAIAPLYVQALFVDGLVVPLALDNWNTDIALQLTMMNLLSAGAVGVIVRVGHKFGARARPNATECKDAPESDTYCTDPYNSLPGGHPAGAFIGAGLSCAHHSYLSLYGNRAVDAIFGCATPVALAATTGVLRVAADQHYASDVLLGSALGFAGGFGLPMALHYGFGGHADSAKEKSAGRTYVIPTGSADHAGMSVVGGF